jgi:hypothetical protein
LLCSGYPKFKVGGRKGDRLEIKNLDKKKVNFEEREIRRKGESMNMATITDQFKGPP